MSDSMGALSFVAGAVAYCGLFAGILISPCICQWSSVQIDDEHEYNQRILWLKKKIYQSFGMFLVGLIFGVGNVALYYALPEDMQTTGEGLFTFLIIVGFFFFPMGLIFTLSFILRLLVRSLILKPKPEKDFEIEILKDSSKLETELAEKSASVV